MKRPTTVVDGRYIRLLKMAPFRRRSGAWRFGANTMADHVVDRLLERGRIVRDGDVIRLAAPQQESQR